MRILSKFLLVVGGFAILNGCTTENSPVSTNELVNVEKEVATIASVITCPIGTIGPDGSNITADIDAIEGSFLDYWESMLPAGTSISVDGAPYILESTDGNNTYYFLITKGIVGADDESIITALELIEDGGNLGMGSGRPIETHTCTGIHCRSCKFKYIDAMIIGCTNCLAQVEGYTDGWCQHKVTATSGSANPGDLANFLWNALGC